MSQVRRQVDDQSLPLALVARQPIYERNQQTFGYELLFRKPGARKAVIDNPDQATAQVIVSSFFEIGMERMVGSATAFINVTRDFILENHCRFLPKDRVVFEISEDTIPDQDLLRCLASLQEEGFQFALDDFAYQEYLAPLLRYCAFVKVDLRQAEHGRMEKELTMLRQYPVKLLAEKVQTSEEFELCQQLGFDYFQGYFLSRPKVVTTPKMPLNRISVSRLMAKLQEPQTTTREVEAMFGGDIALSYRLLRYIDSEVIDFNQKIDSVSHAVRLVGIERLRMFTNLVMLSSLDEKPQSVVRASLVRARMCQLLTSDSGGRNEEIGFTVGLFSKLDSFLGCDMEAAIQLLAFSDEVCSALLAHQGPMGRVLEMVIAFEQADWDVLDRMNADVPALHEAFAQSVAWEEGLVGQAGLTVHPLVM